MHKIHVLAENVHTEWKEKDRKGDLIAKKEGTDRGGKA